MLGWQSNLGMGMPQEMEDAKYKALVELGALQSTSYASQPHQRSKVLAAQKQLLFGKPWRTW